MAQRHTSKDNDASAIKKLMSEAGGKGSPRRLEKEPAEDRSPDYMKDSYTGKPLPYLRK